VLCAYWYARLQELSSKLTGQLADLTSMVRRDLGGEARKKVNTLIITDVHARDNIETFVRDSVMDAREFAWESQLRYYWDRTADDLMIRQCTGKSLKLVQRDFEAKALPHLYNRMQTASCVGFASVLVPSIQNACCWQYRYAYIHKLDMYCRPVPVRL